VNEFDTRVFDLLDAFTPEPPRWPDWQDVVRRTRRRHKRRIVVALGAAIAVLASAAAVTAALGGFDSWLGGSPGKPAPKSELSKRSYYGFPKNTKLRELIRTRVAGKLYVLYGFRSGESLCLRLKAVSLGHSIGPACAPASRLRHAPAPILPVIANGGFADKYNHPSAATSFGIAADGLSRVVAHTVDGDHPATLAGNAYLWIQDEPNTGQRAFSITAVSSDGSRVTLPLGETMLPVARPRGPVRIEARIAHPTVGWYLRGEKRGVARGPTDPWTRFVKPDPTSNVRVGLSGRWCLLVAYGASGPSSGCTDNPWSQGPLWWTMTGEYGTDFMRISGVVADGVNRVTVFLADGQRQRAFLRDNLFTTLAATAEFPARIVAYDNAGRVVGIVTPPVPFRQITPPAARRLHPALRVHGPRGAVAVGHVGRRVRDYRCWRVDFSTGQSRGECDSGAVTGSAIWVDLVQPAGADLFVIGHVHGFADHIRLEFPNGDVQTTRPVGELFVIAVPRGHLTTGRQTAIVRSYFNNAIPIKRVGVVFKLRP
jgi:hypothetical protein